MSLMIQVSPNGPGSSIHLVAAMVESVRRVPSAGYTEIQLTSGRIITTGDDADVVCNKVAFALGEARNAHL